MVIDAFLREQFQQLGPATGLIIKNLLKYTKQMTQRSQIFLLGQILCLHCQGNHAIARGNYFTMDHIFLKNHYLVRLSESFSCMLM